ncbi:hypothetical protein L1049_010449 [Liquidambar formosana]|uniref:LysM domain-containing protein n=1 Tax=Liquidambar formosana TaxID=63359 RepID=A0AAP0NAA3_LIQFO
MAILSHTKSPVALLAFHALLFLCFKSEANCRTGCDLSYASYYVWEGSNLTYISNIFGRSITEILRYNPTVPNQDSIHSGSRINVPFSCECLNGDFLGHTFSYITQSGDTYRKVAERAFTNLTTVDWVQRINDYPPSQIPDYVPINVTVNCSVWRWRCVEGLWVVCDVPSSCGGDFVVRGGGV